ncbi:hypothetical protein GCM10010211_78570 [Streptomyces albospinus]|uniref:Secreted protein n=2 Tax=Streptomyces albospinus TaxID=285515 RepID=A0ABQ2VPS4_9ACTN|nr:hypothetical protein GCM10010211_78570 [Streptomyces albospinus]
MRKLRKAAVVVTVLGSVSLLGAGTTYACGEKDGNYNRPQSAPKGAYQQQSSRGHDHGKSNGSKLIIRQHTACRTWDDNVDVFGEVGFGNHLGNWHREHDRPEIQSTRIGTSQGCNNIVRL